MLSIPFNGGPHILEGTWPDITGSPLSSRQSGLFIQLAYTSILRYTRLCVSRVAVNLLMLYFTEYGRPVSGVCVGRAHDFNLQLRLHEVKAPVIVP